MDRLCLTRKPGKAVSIAAMLLLAAACTTPPPQPESQRDASVDFSRFRTYGWMPAPSPDGLDEPVKLLDRNIRAAIATEMQRRGYREDLESPDLRIAYETASADKMENSPVRVGVGVGSWGGNVGGSVNVGTPSIRNYREGTLVIHAIDRERNAEVWQGRIARRMSDASLEPAAIQEAVSAAMRDFPTPAPASPPAP